MSSPRDVSSSGTEVSSPRYVFFSEINDSFSLFSQRLMTVLILVSGLLSIEGTALVWTFNF